VLRDRLFLLHESLGVTLFGIAVVRVWVRWTYPPPPLPGAMPMAMRLVARGAHLAMYLLLLGLPVLGYVATNAHGFTLRYFGVISLPVAVGKDAALAPVLSYLHFLGTMSLLGLIGLHLMAVGFHSLVLRVGLGRRMA
jgi:cytochrome b561